MKRSSTVFIVVAAILLAFLLFRSSTTQQTTKQIPTKETQSTISVSQKITTASAKESSAEKVLIEKGNSALDLLQQTIEVEMKGEGKNAFVTSINGVAADEKKKEYWALYINGKLAEVGAGSYILEDGDEIEWKKEAF